MTRRKRWLAGLALVLLVAAVADQGVPLLFRWRPIRRVLHSRLEYAFGRPVEVGSFDLSLLRGLRLEANFITVAEDPRFGQEFFLYADSLTAGLDWPALLRGRLRFARFSFTRPSLNVVISSGGVWNVETWLESRATSGTAALRGAVPAARPLQIAVREGRINFKRGMDKLPFALADLNGTLSPEPGGRWRLEFEANLLRAGVALQDAGTLRFLGRLPEAGALPAAQTAGSPLVASLPAQFDLIWQRASLSDALRLATGADHGVRGGLEGSLSVRGPTGVPVNASSDEGTESRQVAPGEWSFHAAFRASGVHRWDLPPRVDNPAVNLDVEGAVAPDGARWQITKLLLEAPHSSLRANGNLVRGNPGETQFRFLSSSIYFDDLFAWYRAFHPGVADRLAFDGYLGVDAELSGWPPRVARAALATDGVRISVPGVNQGLALGRAVLQVTPKGAELAPVAVLFGDSSGNFRLSAKAVSVPGSPAQITLAGETERVEELYSLAAALGLTRAPGWHAEGAVRARLRWQGTLVPWGLAPSGTIDLEDASFRAGALALPIRVANARVEMTASQRRIRVSEAEFLGAKWKGMFTAPGFAGPWSFSLAADRLESAEFGHWIPKPAASALALSALPGDDLDPLRIAWPQEFAATGQVSAGEIDIGRLRLGQLKARASVENRRLELLTAEAEFYGGRVRGNFRASFDATPSYALEAHFERVNLAAVADPHPSLQGCCSGTGRSDITLTAKGVGRDALLESLRGQGTAEIDSAQVHSLDLFTSIDAAEARPGKTEFRRTAASFSITSGKTRFEHLELLGPGISVRGTGTVSFSGALALEFPFDAPRTPKSTDVSSPQTYRVTGTLAAPQLAISAGKP